MPSILKYPIYQATIKYIKKYLLFNDIYMHNTFCRVEDDERFK